MSVSAGPRVRDIYSELARSSLLGNSVKKDAQPSASFYSTVSTRGSCSSRGSENDALDVFLSGHKPKPTLPPIQSSRNNVAPPKPVLTPPPVINRTESITISQQPGRSSAPPNGARQRMVSAQILDSFLAADASWNKREAVPEPKLQVVVSTPNTHDNESNEEKVNKEDAYKPHNPFFQQDPKKQDYLWVGDYQAPKRPPPHLRSRSKSKKENDI
eukprot:NODE_4817_length_1109_cov_36.994929_g4276_i0.p1 GENE.NODE_4817_length_1109_cov_36.994929_g4276_i0~~NODE_4817_length_1109_cov_36.994929_g4276_i0.p1  ORF type:complete len:215 (-),score=40.74 NODE_4817_length_1109_cov_36.994929_g4276_i0:384-1028(-)